MSRPDVSAIITFHREGILCVPALRSYLQCCTHARSQGFTVECIAATDRIDPVTSKYLAAFAGHFNQIERFDFGDSSESRNAAARQASGQYLAYFDGDDLWGDVWLSNAMLCAATADRNSVFHPHVLYFFVKDDFAVQSPAVMPHPRAGSFIMIHEDSTAPGFDPNSLYFDNLWTVNALAPRELYLAHPFPPFRRSEGFGIEDWAWNYRVMQAGIAHRVVPGTVHMIRMKQSGSQNLRNRSEGLLPDLHASTPAAV